MSFKQISDFCQFSWKDIDCFLRPQALACDAIAHPCGERFLFMISLYRAWGGGDGSYAKPHFAFFQEYMSDKIGVLLDLFYPAKRQRVLPALVRMLENGGLVILPANRRYLPSSIYFKCKDAAQYLIVTAYDAASDTFLINDNLHFGARDLSMRYSQVPIAAALLVTAALSYWDTQIAAGSATPHEEKNYWMAHLSPKKNVANYSNAILLHAMCVDYLSLDSEYFTACQLDCRHLLALEKHHSDGILLDNFVKIYLADANTSMVHLDILLKGMGACSSVDVAALAIHLAHYKEQSRRARSKFLVTCLATPTVISDGEWRTTRAHLLQLAIAIRQRFVVKVQELLSVTTFYPVRLKEA